MNLVSARRALVAAILVAAFIVYGSLYPFVFRPLPPGIDVLAELLDAPTPTQVGRGDGLANFALYIPLGLSLALALGGRFRRRVAVPAATLLAALLSLVMELAQLYTPYRVTSIWDLVLNAAGACTGALLAPLLMRLGGNAERPVLADRFALLLLACWLAGRLQPYLPSLDIGEWRASLAPLLHMPIDWRRAARLAVLWWLAGRLVEAALPRATWLVVPMILGTLAAAVPIVGRVLTPAELAGGLGGLLLWAMLRRLRFGDALLVPALIAVVVTEGLEPYAFQAKPRPFGYTPFRSVIRGSFGFGMQAMFYKMLIFGGLIWALTRIRMPVLPATLLVAALALGVSIAQRWLPLRSAEITDALIALTAGLAAWLVTGRAGPGSTPRRR